MHAYSGVDYAALRDRLHLQRSSGYPKTSGQYGCRRVHRRLSREAGLVVDRDGNLLSARRDI